MSYRYAASTRGFYHDDQAAPNDAVEVFDADYTVLMDGQGGGREIQPDADGAPRLVTLVAPPVDLVAYAASARYAREVGGIEVTGIKVATDDRSKLLISGARQGADADPGFTTPFAAYGSVTMLNATQVIALSNAVLAHVRACFATYSDVLKGIAAGTITTPVQIDAAFVALAG